MDLILTRSIFYDLFTWWCLANISMLLLGVLDQEIKIPKDPSRATLGKLECKDLLIPSVVNRV